MAKLTKEEVHLTLSKPEKECDGFDLHLRHSWLKGDTKSLFTITGIDFTEMFRNGDDYVMKKQLLTPIILVNFLKFAIDEKHRISGDHDGNAGVMFNDDSYKKIAQDYIESLKDIK